MDKYQAIQTFWNSFGWDAFNESTVPDDAFTGREGYITYSVSTAPFDSVTGMYASLWQRSTSWSGVLAKAKAIEQALSDGGQLLPFDGGVIWIKPDTPFAQTMSDPDDMTRRVYIMVEVEYISTF